MRAEAQDQMTAVTELAIKVGRERQQKLLRMRKALQTGDTDAVLSLAKDLCGLDEKKDELTQ